MKVLEQKKLLGLIKAIGTASVKLRDQIQTAAVSIIGHAHEHGDVTAANSLLIACGKSVDRQALVDYFEGMGCLRFVPAKGVFELNKTKRKEMAFDYATVDAVKWYEYGKDTNQLSSTFDLKVKVEGLLKSLEKAQKKHAEDAEHHKVENAELAEELQKALATYNLKAAARARAAFEAGDVVKVEVEVPAA